LIGGLLDGYYYFPTINCLSFNLEDKVDFKGEGNVMNIPYWTDPIMNDSTWAQEIEYQGMSWHI
jgi:hypothetical protein